MTWRYAHEPCARERGIYDPYRHDAPVADLTNFSGDRTELMYCASCEAYLWGCYTIREEPW